MIGFNSSIPFKGDDCFAVKVINNNKMCISLIEDIKHGAQVCSFGFSGKKYYWNEAVPLSPVIPELQKSANIPEIKNGDIIKLNLNSTCEWITLSIERNGALAEKTNLPIPKRKLY